MGGLGRDVEDFISRHISSVEQLEILLALWSEPDRVWSCNELSRRLYTTPESVENRATDLVQSRLAIRRDDDFKLAELPRETASAVNGLSEAYARRRVTVIDRIFAGPRGDIQGIADAFRLRAEDE